ncbi:MAG TPA: GspH/FimT family pseudopilin [Vicinamibacterales bacterium]|nr:GspH/FimT family pseudopilin [Vicinamibacterales bacterium]
MTKLQIHDRGGFSLVDIMVTDSVMSIVAAGAVPALMNVSDSMKLGQGQRDIYQEMQTARLVAVASNRPMRIRFNCPAAGQFRLTELIGSPSKPDTNDTASDRCSDTKWTYPANDNDPTSRPNHDGAIRQLPNKVTFGGTATLEFWPDGTVHKQVTSELPWTQLPVSGTLQEIAVVKGTSTKKITVNGLGKIQLIQ